MNNIRGVDGEEMLIIFALFAEKKLFLYYIYSYIFLLMFVNTIFKMQLLIDV